MNIKHRCPCGASIEVTHLSTKDGIAQAQIETASTILEPWIEGHQPHREAAMQAHVANLRDRGAPTIHQWGAGSEPTEMRELWAEKESADF